MGFMWGDLLILMIYHCSGCFSDRNQSEPVGSDRKLVGNWSDSVPSGPIGTDLSDRNPVGQIGQIPYYLGGPVFQNFRSDSDRNPSSSDWFRSENVGHRQDLNHLLEQYQVVSEADKCKGVLEYCSQTVQDFIQSNIHFSVPNWTRLQAEILNAYDADRLESRVRPADLVDFINQNSIQTMSNLTQWKKYYREYKARAGFLKMKGQLTDLQYNGYFWYGIPNQVRSILEEKLFARYPNYDTTDPWPVENVTTLAETYFKRDRFTEKLLPLPVYGLNYKEDEDSDDESEEAYDSEDSDYERERRKKRKQEKKKKKKSRAHLQKGPQTQIMEEEPSRRIIPPPEETDISGIIHQLNTMSLEDPRYGQLYYQAVKKDKGGLVAQCIRRKPLQEYSLEHKIEIHLHTCLGLVHNLTHEESSQTL